MCFYNIRTREACLSFVFLSSIPLRDCYVSEFVQRFQFVPKDSLSTVRFVTVIVIPVSILERLDTVLSIPQSSSVPIDPFSLVLFSSLFDVPLLHIGPNNVRC